MFGQKPQGQGRWTAPNHHTSFQGNLFEKFFCLPTQAITIPIAFDKLLFHNQLFLVKILTKLFSNNNSIQDLSTILYIVRYKQNGSVMYNITLQKNQSLWMDGWLQDAILIFTKFNLGRTPIIASQSCSKFKLNFPTWQVPKKFSSELS